MFYGPGYGLGEYFAADLKNKHILLFLDGVIHVSDPGA